MSHQYTTAQNKNFSIGECKKTISVCSLLEGGQVQMKCCRESLEISCAEKKSKWFLNVRRKELKLAK